MLRSIGILPRFISTILPQCRCSYSILQVRKVRPGEVKDLMAIRRGRACVWTRVCRPQGSAPTLHSIRPRDAQHLRKCFVPLFMVRWVAQELCFQLSPVSVWGPGRKEDTLKWGWSKKDFLKGLMARGKGCTREGEQNCQSLRLAGNEMRWSLVPGNQKEGILKLPPSEDPQRGDQGMTSPIALPSLPPLSCQDSTLGKPHQKLVGEGWNSRPGGPPGPSAGEGERERVRQEASRGAVPSCRAVGHAGSVLGRRKEGDHTAVAVLKES